VLALGYSKDVPQYHVTVELPVDYPWVRRPRVRSAEATREAAQLRFSVERAGIALEADTLYTKVLAARAHMELSRRNALDADSLRRIAIARRNAGDASDLDVELATVTAGQQENVAAADSLTLLSALLDLQTVIGVESERVEIVPVDSLTLAPLFAGGTDGDNAGPAATTVPISVAAAGRALVAAELTLRQQRRSLFALPGLTFGFDTRDPSHETRGLLPVVGVALPLPLLNRNRGAVALAEAERARARAQLDLARAESRARIGRALRERTTALARVRRDTLLATAAERVAAMSLTAYREGAASLPNVLEAQRSARDVRSQFVDDLAQAWIATATLRVVSMTSASTPNLARPR
jgi:outer membrane protein, heavy metal efflux system